MTVPIFTIFTLFSPIFKSAREPDLSRTLGIDQAGRFVDTEEGR